MSIRTLKRRATRRRRTPPGTAPGTLLKDPQALPPRMNLMAYSATDFIETPIASPEEVLPHRHRWPVLWLNVEGLGDVGLVQRLGELFGLHALALEDTVNVHQRAKVEPYGDHLFIVMRMIDVGESFLTEQMAIFVGRDFVITFQERPGDGFNSIRDRIRAKRPKLVGAGPDYLVYSIIDAIVDQYFPVLESYGDRLDALEDRVIARPARSVVAELHDIKRELLELRRAIWPLRDAVWMLYRDDQPLISPETRVYLRDCHDHTLRLIDFVETDREICSDLMDVYLTSVSNRMNEIMKVLTVMASVFIPLTFISSIYGMNFDTDASPLNMPELKWYWGYPACLALMAAVGGGMLFYFWRKGWLGSFEHDDRMPSEAARRLESARRPSEDVK